MSDLAASAEQLVVYYDSVLNTGMPPKVRAPRIEPSPSWIGAWQPGLEAALAVRALVRGEVDATPQEIDRVRTLVLEADGSAADQLEWVFNTWCESHPLGPAQDPPFNAP